MRARANWGMSQGGWVELDRSKTSCSHHLLSSSRRFHIYLFSSSILSSFSFFLLFFLFLAVSPLQQHTTYAYSHHHSQQQHPSCRHHPQEHSYRQPSHDLTCVQPLDNTHDSHCPGRHYTADSNRAYTMNLLNKNDALSLAKVRLSCCSIRGRSIAFTTERMLSGSVDGGEEERKGDTSGSRSLPEICFLSYAKCQQERSYRGQKGQRRERDRRRRVARVDSLFAGRSSSFHSFNKCP